MRPPSVHFDLCFGRKLGAEEGLSGTRITSSGLLPGVRRRARSRLLAALGCGCVVGLGTLLLGCSDTDDGNGSGNEGGSANAVDFPTGGGGPTEPFEGTDSGLEFSTPRGIYDEPFDLTISHASATRVRYSLDSSDPRTSPTALEADLPLTLRVDPSDTSNRYLAPTYIVRATVGGASAPPETVTTQSYLFIDRVVELSPDQEPPGDNWPESGGGDDTQMMDYGMDPDVTRSSDYSTLMNDSLRLSIMGWWRPDSALFRLSSDV